MENRTALINGKLITPFREINNGCVVLKDEQIEKIGKKAEIEIPEGTKI